MDEITIGDKIYISSKQAAKITGYAKDYVGQLCREGRVEARLVGRNWYVLDSSIREHRFGKEEELEQPDLEAEESPDRSSTWQKPTYEAETPVLVPEFEQKRPESFSYHASSPAIADMQSAWKEWFEEKRPAAAAPVEEDVQDEEIMPSEELEASVVASAYVEETVVDISRIAAEEPVAAPKRSQESPIDVHRAHFSRTVSEHAAAPAPIVDIVRPVRATTVVRPRTRMRTPVAEKSPWTGVMRSLLLVVALAAGLVAIVGTGHGEKLFSGTSLDFGAQKEFMDFLGGKSTFEGTL